MRSVQTLQDRFLAVLIAVCTNEMRWFRAAGNWFVRIGECVVIDGLKLVILFLSIPCLKAGEFFFKLAYSLNRCRITCLGCKDLLPEISDSRVPYHRIVHVLEGLCDAKHLTERAEAC